MSLKPHTVIILDFNGVNFTEKGNLEATIEYYLANWEKIYGETPREVPMLPSPATRSWRVLNVRFLNWWLSSMKTGVVRLFRIH